MHQSLKVYTQRTEDILRSQAQRMMRHPKGGRSASPNCQRCDEKVLPACQRPQETQIRRGEGAVVGWAMTMTSTATHDDGGDEEESTIRASISGAFESIVTRSCTSEIPHVAYFCHISESIVQRCCCNEPSDLMIFEPNLPTVRSLFPIHTKHLSSRPANPAHRTTTAISKISLRLGGL